MTVGELMMELERFDEGAEVMIAMQPNYPFECSITGVVSRREADPDFEDEDEDEAEAKRHRDTFASDGKGSDVFILEGGQVRYGSRKLWDEF